MRRRPAEDDIDHARLLGHVDHLLTLSQSDSVRPAGETRTSVIASGSGRRSEVRVTARSPMRAVVVRVWTVRIGGLSISQEVLDLTSSPDWSACTS
jgi:hypothetical protein